jgi:hypothetical protein
MMQWLKRLDFLAQGMSLSVAGGKAVKTRVGALLTIICASLFGVAAAFIIAAFISTDNPNVADQTDISKHYPKINLAKEKLLPILFLFLDEVTSVSSEEALKYVTLRFVKYRYITNTLDNGQQNYETLTFTMPVVACKVLMESNKPNLFIPKPEDGFIYQLTKDYGLCVDHDDLEGYVQGRISDSIMDAARFEILPCSLDPAECQPESEILRLSFIFSTGYAKVNLQNLQQPVTFGSSDDDFYFLNPLRMQMMTVRYMLNKVVDDKGYFFGEKDRIEYYGPQNTIYNTPYRDKTQLTCTTNEIADETCKAYFRYEMMSSGHVRVFTRSYKGFIETLGDLGGTREIIYAFTIFFYAFYNDYVKKKTVVAQIYRLVQEKGSPGKKSNKKDNLDKARDDTYEDFETGKDTEVKPAPKHIINEAYRIVERSLDVVTIVKQINILKLLTHFMLKEYHCKLSPLVALNLDLNQRTELEGPQNPSLDQKHSIRTASSEQASPNIMADETLSMDKAYEHLRRNVVKRRIEDGSFNKGPPESSKPEKSIQLTAIDGGQQNPEVDDSQMEWMIDSNNNLSASKPQPQPPIKPSKSKSPVKNNFSFLQVFTSKKIKPDKNAKQEKKRAQKPDPKPVKTLSKLDKQKTSQTDASTTQKPPDNNFKDDKQFLKVMADDFYYEILRNAQFFPFDRTRLLEENNQTSQAMEVILQEVFDAVNLNWNKVGVSASNNKDEKIGEGIAKVEADNINNHFAISFKGHDELEP